MVPTREQTSWRGTREWYWVRAPLHTPLTSYVFTSDGSSSLAVHPGGGVCACRIVSPQSACHSVALFYAGSYHFVTPVSTWWLKRNFTRRNKERVDCQGIQQGVASHTCKWDEIVIEFVRSQSTSRDSLAIYDSSSRDLSGDSGRESRKSVLR